MRHYILTRSAYARTVPIEVNRRRLELLANVTAASLRAQTCRDVTWLVMVDPADPLLRDRKAAIGSAGLPVIFAPPGRLERASVHDRPYSNWRHFIRWGDETLTTRLDDDDALAPWAMERVHDCAARGRRRAVVWTFPDGWRIAGSEAWRITWPWAQFGTLHSPKHRFQTIYDVNHVGVARLAPLEPVSDEPAWLWVRHALTRSHINVGAQTQKEGRTETGPYPIDRTLRAAFPVDWRVIERGFT